MSLCVSMSCRAAVLVQNHVVDLVEVSIQVVCVLHFQLCAALQCLLRQAACAF